MHNKAILNTVDWWARGIGLAGLGLSLAKILYDALKSKRWIKIRFEYGMTPPPNTEIALQIRVTNEAFRPITITAIGFQPRRNNTPHFGLSYVYRNLPEGRTRIYTEEHRSDLFNVRLEDGDSLIGFVPRQIVRTFAADGSKVKVMVSDNLGNVYSKKVKQSLIRQIAGPA